MERKQIFPPASPLLVEGIATACAFVKVPTGVWEHTSLSTPVTEDSKTAAKIWSLGGPQCITLHTLVTPRAGSFPFKCEPESIKPNELRKPGDYLSVYPPRLFHTTSGFTRCRNARGKYLQPNVNEAYRSFKFDHYKKNDNPVKGQIRCCFEHILKTMH